MTIFLQNFPQNLKFFHDGIDHPVCMINMKGRIKGNFICFSITQAKMRLRAVGHDPEFVFIIGMLLVFGKVTIARQHIFLLFLLAFHDLIPFFFAHFEHFPPDPVCPNQVGQFFLLLWVQVCINPAGQ